MSPLVPFMLASITTGQLRRKTRPGQPKARTGVGHRYDGRYCRSAFRGLNSPDHRYHDAGFRVVAVPVADARQ
jgi:formylglycine-generating enzyme required for sulfatase activity